jgi:hypothetical protein
VGKPVRIKSPYGFFTWKKLGVLTNGLVRAILGCEIYPSDLVGIKREGSDVRNPDTSLPETEEKEKHMDFNFLDLLKILLSSMAIIIPIFLILREFWCWYFKINKIIALFEEQNRLLNALNQYLIPVVKSNYNAIEVKNSIRNGGNRQYTITQEIKLFAYPDENSSIICRLLEGEIITFLDKREINNMLWYNVKDNENNTGWCLLDVSEGKT